MLYSPVNRFIQRLAHRHNQTSRNFHLVLILLVRSVSRPKISHGHQSHEW